MHNSSLTKRLAAYFVVIAMASLAVQSQTNYFPSLSTNNSSTGPYGAFTGLNQFQSGAVLGPTTFAGLSTGNFVGALNGTAVVVTDGTPGSPCTGGGTGALAIQLSGAWLCLPTTSGGGGGSVTGSGTANTLTMWTGTSTLGNSQSSQVAVSGGTELNLNYSRFNLANRNTGTGFAEIFCTSLCQGINIESFASGGNPNANILLSQSSGQAEITTGDGSGNGGVWIFEPGLSKIMAYPPMLFTNLGSSSAGFFSFCTNCTPNTSPCSTVGSQSGAFAFGNGTSWTCMGASGGGTVTGSGTTGTLPVWSGSTSLGNSLLSETGSGASGTVIQAGTNFQFNTNSSNAAIIGCTSTPGCSLLEVLAPTVSSQAGASLVVNEWSGSNVSASMCSGGTAANGLCLQVINNGTVTVVDYPTSTFANLPGASTGYVVYCTNCTVNSSPCTGSSTGAWAFAEAGAWKCPF